MPYIFNTINNFRDLSESADPHNIRRSSGFDTTLHHAIWYRSATLDYATDSDVEKLVTELGVKTIIDLRSEVEIKAAIESGKAFSSFPAAAGAKAKASDLVGPSTSSSPKFKSHGKGRSTVMINFAGKRYRRKAVWNSCPFKIRVKLLYYVLTKQKPKAVKLVGSEVLSKKGLQGLYYDFIDYCYEEMGKAIKVLAAPENYPVVIHCTQGKDRTGLVIALALSAIGVDDDSIVSDYAQSRSGLNPVKQQMVHEMAKDGLDCTFADAPPEVMRNTLNYIREKYGSMDAYIVKLGITPKIQAALRSILLGDSDHPCMPTQLNFDKGSEPTPIVAAVEAEAANPDC